MFDRMEEWLRDFYEGQPIRRSARRIGLRDKGPTENFTASDGKEKSAVHSKCYTRIRIGIDSGGNAHLYCWKCEYVHGPSGSPNPGSKEPLPEPKPGTGSEVIAFADYKKSA